MMRRLACLVPLLALAACTPPAPAATPAPEPAPALPPIPLVTGPIALRVQYPSANALVNARDSTFLFGTVGTGEATLTVNGDAVRVLPNGAWLGWLPVPREPRYELVAVRGADTVRRTHPVRLVAPRLVLADSGPLVVDSASLAPSRTYRALPPGERLRVSVRAPANASAWVQLSDGRRLGLMNAGVNPGPRQRRQGFDQAERGGPQYVRDSLLWAREVPAGELTGDVRVIVARGADTVTLPLVGVDTMAAPRWQPPSWVLLGADSAAASDTDRVVVGKPIPGGTYRWFFLPGTLVEMTGHVGDHIRVRLDEQLDVWVEDATVRVPTAGLPGPRRTVANLRVVPDTGWVDVVFPVGDRPPHQVQVTDEGLELTLHGTTANTDIINYAGRDSLVRDVRWEQVTRDRARFHVRLARPVYGWLVFWRAGSLVLRVRRPPAVNVDRPLAGLTIAVDPGHPPVGATGPTGYYEGEATLAIGQRLRSLLEARGATVVMTRTTPAPVALGERPIIARRANAHAFVSIHLNALPDGINPYTAQGTGTYYFNAPSAPLARAVQAGMVRRMGLRDHGTFYDNLAVVRPTWMPSVLCEGAFLMIPEHEAALRTPEFQERYARGVVDGLEAYFRTLR
jgi:N-acetylmuramoyl-L-alanine amidase